MNDKEAFKKWSSTKHWIGYRAKESWCEQAWQAALEYERERSKILFEALEKIITSSSHGQAIGLATVALDKYNEL
jgi:hypothetical protein